MPTKPRIRFPPELLELCRRGWRPQSINALLLILIRGHFADPNNIEDERLKLYPYKNNDSTGILIEPIAKWKPTLTEKRPAVILKRNTAKVVRMGINDKMQLGIGPAAARDVYATFVVGSHTLFCIAGEGAEAENLGAEVYRELIEFGPVIREMMNLHKFLLSEVGELSIIDDEGTENFVVPVSVTYAFEEAWEITQATPKLSKITLSLNTLI